VSIRNDARKSVASITIRKADAAAFCASTRVHATVRQLAS